MERRLCCPSESDTARIGARLAALLSVPAFVALYGELGTGKTALVRGLGEALGARDLTSPTFTILCEYDTSPRLVHMDAYRLSGAEELFAIGFEEYLHEPALLLLEWAERVPEALPAERLDIHIEGSGNEPRALRFVPRGERYERVVAAL